MLNLIIFFMKNAKTTKSNVMPTKEEIDRKKKFLFFQKMEKKVGKFIVVLFLGYMAICAILLLLSHFDVVDLKSKIASDFAFVLAWLLGVSAVLWFGLANIRIFYDDSSSYDVYPNLR